MTAARLRIVAALAAAASSSIALASDLPVVETKADHEPTPITSVDVRRSADVLPAISTTADVDRVPALDAPQSSNAAGDRQAGVWIQPYNPTSKSAHGGGLTGSTETFTSVIPLPAAAGLAAAGLGGVLIGRRRLSRVLRG